jgi:hypothetical protein
MAYKVMWIVGWFHQTGLTNPVVLSKLLSLSNFNVVICMGLDNT